MIKRRNTYFILMCVSGVLLLADMITLFVLFEGDRISHSYEIMLYLIFIFALSVLITAFASLTISLTNTLKNLIKENEYNLNRSYPFYNLPIFTKQILIHKKYLRKREGYLICFTPVKKGVYGEQSSHDMISVFYGHISDALAEYFTISKRFKIINCYYCFNHGSYLIYLACNKDELDKAISYIENEVYNIAKREDIRIFIRPSFGIAVNEPNDKDTNIYKLINRATQARRIAEANFETITYFDQNTMVKKTEYSPEEIIKALESDEFVVYYQPKFHLATKRFYSCEALIRWDSPKYGLLSPGAFIGQIESTGLIHNIDMAVFEQVCKDLRETKKRGRRLLSVSINFSLYEFYSPGFVDDIISVVEKYEVNPSLIELEITETTSSANSFLAISILKKFKDYGFKILMDDFGVGYSNLTNLKKMPIDVVKIDKSFIDDIVLDTRSREVVKFLISFCKANNLEVIAEGVDDAKQIEILKKFKCDAIQGYYYSKPIPKKDLEKLKASNPFERKESI